MDLQFIRPDNLINPLPKFQGMLKSIIKLIGKEQAEFTMDTICLQWGLANGYNMNKVDNRYVFTHVSINEKDHIVS